MRNYVFAIPGNVGYEYIKASNLKEAEDIANEICRNHSFLGGAVQPLVTEVGKSYADSK
jgi:hypothetical protein